MGLEPTTFDLEVQHASPLRHVGFTSMEKTFSIFIFSVYLYKTPLIFLLSLILAGCLLLKRKYHRNVTSYCLIILKFPKNSVAALFRLQALEGKASSIYMKVLTRHADQAETTVLTLEYSLQSLRSVTVLSWP